MSNISGNKTARAVHISKANKYPKPSASSTPNNSVAYSDAHVDGSFQVDVKPSAQILTIGDDSVPPLSDDISPIPAYLTPRKNLLALSVSRDWQTGELDRYMIALHRFQTEGRVAYRRIIGMHGGGGGWKGDHPTDPDYYYNILKKKAEEDFIAGHYPKGYPDNRYWPEPVPNAAYPKQYSGDNPYTYTFCWHGEPQFLLWHRPLMIEIELGLQDYDPAQPDVFDPTNPETFGNKIPQGEDALGLHYWAWETWDGTSLPLLFTSPTYVVRSNVYHSKGYPSGTIMPNPLYRWYAPVSVDDQMKEKFPDFLRDDNCTTRNPCLTDLNVIPDIKMYWPIDPEDKCCPTALNLVSAAFRQNTFLKFSTEKYGSQNSIEEPHNLLHNYVGGFTMGGLQGPGKQIFDGFGTAEQPAYYTGTMAQNQSIYDPIFLPHHANIERQLCSWQKLHPESWEQSEGLHPATAPPQDILESVLYPWTKPDKVAEGKYSWNTPSSTEDNGTLSDWWYVYPNLTYGYDVHLQPVGVIQSTDKVKPTIVLCKFNYLLRGGQFLLHHNEEVVAVRNLLSAASTGCGRCTKNKGYISFDITHFDAPSDGSSDETLQKAFKVTWFGITLTPSSIEILHEDHE